MAHSFIGYVGLFDLINSYGENDKHTILSPEINH